MMAMPDTLVKDLNAILEQERDALLGGNIAVFENLIAQKAKILQTIGELPKEELRRFEGMKPRLLRNQKLAQSAIKGMRIAIKRAKDIKDVSLGLRTYKKDGSGRSIAMRTLGGFSKRS
jgi:flagellar biosynthesis/type III secretory pathway chaperone